MPRKYDVSESVGKGWEKVESYDDLEKHHPTWKEDPKKRNYSEIDGSREEFIRSSNGDRLVSKDFVLSVDGNVFVDIPSPASGYIKRSPQMDRWGAVAIYESAENDAKLIARVLHMNPIHVRDGDKIEYGELLGRQSNKAPIKLGLHTHIDFNEWHLNQFREYIQDLDSGAITPEGRINEYLKADGRKRHMDGERPGDHWFRNGSAQSGFEVPKMPSDPRDLSHPDHAMHEGVRTKLRDLYAEQGLSIDGEKLDRLTAGVMADARRSQMTRVDLLEFSEDYDTGKVDVNGNIIAFQGDPTNPASPYSATTIDQAIRTPAEDSYRQFDTATQQQTQQWDRFLAQEQELSQSRGMHHSL